MSSYDNPNPHQQEGGGNGEQHPYIGGIVIRAWQFVVKWSRKLGLHETHTPHWFIAVFTLLLVIFAYSAWRESVRGTDQTRRQADYLQGQLSAIKQEERAWVGLVGVPIPSGDLVVDAKFGQEKITVPVKFTISNTGKNPAKSIKLRFRPTVIPDEIVPKASEIETELCHWASGGVEGASVFPGGTTTIRRDIDIPIDKAFKDHVFSPNNDKRFKSGFTIFVPMCIGYRDTVTEEQRWSPYSLYMTNTEKDSRGFFVFAPENIVDGAIIAKPDDIFISEAELATPPPR